MKILNLVWMSFLALAVVSCDQVVQNTEEPVDLEAVKKEIQEIENSFAQAIMDRNAEAVVEFYADDFLALANEEPMITSKDQMLESLREEFAQDSSQYTLRFEVVDVMAEGDLVIETGRSIGTSAEGMERTGKYLVVWKKFGDTYKTIRDAGNNDERYCDCPSANGEETKENE